MGKWVDKIDEWENKAKSDLENHFRENFNLPKYVEGMWDICESFEVRYFYFNIWISGIFLFSSSLKDSTDYYCGLTDGRLSLNELSFGSWKRLYKYVESGEDFIISIHIEEDESVLRSIAKRIQSLFPDIEPKFRYEGVISCIIKQ